MLLAGFENVIIKFLVQPGKRIHGLAAEIRLCVELAEQGFTIDYDRTRYIVYVPKHLLVLFWKFW